MTNHWARILMGLIFVFVTISSPMRAHAAPVAPHSVATQMEGMSDACAKAMMAQAAKAAPHKPADHSGGCCADGCNCPLSHCPATPPLLAPAISAPLYDGVAILTEPADQALVSFHTDTLIRPPRA